MKLNSYFKIGEPSDLLIVVETERRRVRRIWIRPLSKTVWKQFFETKIIQQNQI